MLEDELIHALVYGVTLHQHLAKIVANFSLRAGHGITLRRVDVAGDGLPPAISRSFLLRRSWIPYCEDLPGSALFFGYFFSLIVTEARVVSQSMCRVQVSPALSNEMVKFSTGVLSCVTCTSSVRVKSNCSP